MQTSVDKQIAARFVLYFFAVLSILMLSSPSRVVWGPLVGGVQDCVKVFILAIAKVPGGVAAFINRSVTITHAGCEGVRFRYALSHIISMASFQALMSNRFRPPSLSGLYRCSRAILGDVSWSHMKSLIIWDIASSMWVGMPWVVARNWV